MDLDADRSRGLRHDNAATTKAERIAGQRALAAIELVVGIERRLSIFGRQIKTCINIGISANAEFALAPNK